MACAAAKPRRALLRTTDTVNRNPSGEVLGIRTRSHVLKLSPSLVLVNLHCSTVFAPRPEAQAVENPETSAQYG